MTATEPLGNDSDASAVEDGGAPELAAVPDPTTDGDSETDAQPERSADAPASAPPATSKGRTFAKASLVALAHGIEASLLADEPDPDDLPVVIALFQDEAYFDVERRRYHAIARNSLCTLVGFVDQDPDVPSPIHGVGLRPGEEIASLFGLIVISKCICVSLLGTDSSEPAAAEQERTFATTWSFDRPTAVAEARRIIGILGDRVPEELRPQIEQRLADSEKAVPRRIEARLTASFEQMVRKYESVATKLHALEKLEASKGTTKSPADKGVNERDSITGIMNRRGLARYLGERLLTPAETPRLAVVWIDVDELEELNRAHGRGGGDAAMKGIATVLTEHLRDEDCLARWGDDEFVAVMPAIEIGSAKRRAEEFVEAVASMSLPAPHNAVNASISCGVAIGDVLSLSLEKLCETLVRARGGQRGRTVVGDYLTSE